MIDRRFFGIGIAVALLGMIACGGSDDTLFGPAAIPPPGGSETAELGGVWFGYFTSDTDVSRQYNVVAMTTDQGETEILFPYMADQHLAGIVSSDNGNDVAGTVFCYVGTAGPFIGMIGTESMSLDGTMKVRDTFGGRYTSDSDAGQFVLYYDDVNERPSSLETIAGLYQYSAAASGGDMYTLTLDIDNAGRIFGQDTESCTYAGQVGLIDTRYNVYDVDLTISDCDSLSSTYGGLASVWPRSGGDGTWKYLLLSASSGQAALSVQFVG